MSKFGMGSSRNKDRVLKKRENRRKKKSEESMVGKDQNNLIELVATEDLAFLPALNVANICAR